MIIQYVQKFIFRRFPVSAFVGKLWNIIKLSFRWLFCSDIFDVRLSEYSFQDKFSNYKNLYKTLFSANSVLSLLTFYWHFASFHFQFNFNKIEISILAILILILILARFGTKVHFQVILRSTSPGQVYSVFLVAVPFLLWLILMKTLGFSKIGT